MLRLEPSRPWAGIFGSDCGQHRSWRVGMGAWRRQWASVHLGLLGPSPHCAGTRQGRMLGEPHPQGKDGRVGSGKLLLLRYLHLSYCEVRG